MSSVLKLGIQRAIPVVIQSDCSEVRRGLFELPASSQLSAASTGRAVL
jgi:hypothetical protein